MSDSYQFLNTSQTVPSSFDDFQITTSSSTDIWRTPPSRDDFSAPVLQRSLPVNEFRSVRVTVQKSEWIQLYDQGGLVITFPQKDGVKPKWVKGGVELMDGKPRVAVVATDRWSDCALQVHSSESVTIEFQREIKEGKVGAKLWVWVVDGEKRSLIREITWVFEEGETSDGTMTVGAYAARPHSGSGELVVHLSGFEVKTA
ncbi:MAG: hypothetical protein M1823_005029 [Watsoniomyces obsoletus]|nr:MAG: hypothetical protein M1823_005029 [Watsoniomyces obsoletus]